MNSNDLITEKIKAINNRLQEIAGERGKASMKGERNAPTRLIANITIKGHNEKIIEETHRIIKILKEENEGLQQIIDRIQSKPPL